MVVAPADIPIDRADVMEWLSEWQKMKDRPPVKQFIRDKVDSLALPDTMVTKAVDGERVTDVHIADLIINDLESYGVDPSS